MALMKKLTSAVVASSLVLGLAGVAAATTPDKVQAAATRMQKLNLVKGVDSTGTDLALNANLTRAQLVTILVRAFGQDANAKYLDGAAAFTDTANHPWASGYIAMAKRIIAERTNGKEVVGLPDGSFNPDGNVTAAEAVAFLMKFVGAPADSTKAWPDNYISGALNAGIITAEDKAVLDGIKNTPATRGLAFYLADRAFYGYKLAEGGTVYTTFVDSAKPVVTVDNAASSNTLEEKVTVTGTVPADVVSVTVGSLDNAATITDGKFTASVNLAIGDNTILVHAVDRAGNAGEQTIKVTRTVGAAASIEASDITVAAGGTAAVTATVKDAKGNAITGATVTGDSTVGTFDGTSFKAGQKAGTGTLTLKVGEVTKTVNVTVTAGAVSKVVADKAAAAPGELVTLTAQDQYGNAITSGVTFSQTSANAMLDSNTGKFIASKAGSYTVSATAGGATVTGTVGVYGAASGVKLVAPDALVPNDATEYDLKVQVVDDNGNLVADYKGDVSITTDLSVVDLTADANGAYHVTAKNGVATFTVTAPGGLKDSEVDVNMTAKVDGSDDITDTASVNVTSQIATSLKLSAPKFLAVNDDRAKGYVYVLDQNGEYMVNGSWDVTLSTSGLAKLSTDSAAVIGDGDSSITVAAVGGGTAFYLVGNDETALGAITTTAAYTGFTSVTGTTTAVYGLDQSKLALTQLTTAPVKAAGQEVYQLKLQIQDKNGVPRNAAADEAFTLNFDSTSADQIYAKASTSSTVLDADVVTDAANKVDGTTGNITITVPATKNTVYVNVTAAKLTGTVTVKASGQSLTSSSSSVAFTAGDAEQVTFTRDAINVLKGANITTKVVAQVKDASGNAVAKSGVKVKFTPSSKSYVKLGGSAVDSLEATTDANGQASVDVALIPGSTSTSVDVDIDANNDGTYDTKGDTVTLALEDVITNSITANTYVTRKDASNNDVTTKTSTFNAGEKIEVRVTAKDNNGNAITDASAIDLTKTLQFTGLAGDGKDIDESIDTLNADGNTTWTVVKDASNNFLYYKAEVTAAKAGSFSFQVADAGVAADVKSASRSLTINAGTADHLVLAEASDDAVTVDSGKVKAFTVRVADKAGNLLSADKVTSAVKFTVNLANLDTTESPTGTYYEVRVGSETGRSIALDSEELTIAAARNSYTIYVLTNDTDKAELTITGTAGAMGAAVPVTVNVNQ